MECTICCDSGELLSLQCKCMICSSCMLKSIDAKYFEVIDEISCPGSCTHKHSINHLMKDVNGLNDLLLYKYIKTQADIRICPRKDCNYSGVMLSNCSQFECHCGYSFRVKNDVWNAKSFIMNLLTVRECPKCNRNIYKNGGCNHMTCKCNYEFCWICTQQFKEHNKVHCYTNITIKYILLIFLILNICYQLRLLQSFMTVLAMGIKYQYKYFRLLLFNGSLMFFYLSVNELYQISKLNIECNKFYSDGNETFKRIINQKWIMFIILMSQFCILCFIFYLWIQERFIETYFHFLCSELSVLLIVAVTVKIRK